MGIHGLYPGFINLHYTGNGHPHVQKQPLLANVEGSGPATVLRNDGTFQSWNELMDAYVALLKVFMKTTDSVVSADLWNITSEGEDPVFIETYDISVVGTNAGAASPNSQRVITFRTEFGGLYRWYLMEAPCTLDQVVNPPFGGDAATINLTDFLIGTGGFFGGRDGGRLRSALREVTKVNDALRKKHILNS
jgi:hypothetical protein